MSEEKIREKIPNIDKFLDYYMPECSESDGEPDDNHDNCPMYDWNAQVNKFMNETTKAIAQAFENGELFDE